MVSRPQHQREGRFAAGASNHYRPFETRWRVRLRTISPPA